MPGILSCSVISDKLFVLQRSDSETVVKLLNHRLPKTNLNKYHLKYTVAMTLPCSAERLFSVPFHKCFGGQDGNELKLFYYSKSKEIIKLEKELEVKSLTKPSLSDDGMVIVGTESGVAVHQMYGEGLKFLRHDDFDGFVKCVFIKGNVVTAAVLHQNSTKVLQNSPHDFGIDLCSAICNFYHAIGYVPPVVGKKDHSFHLTIVFNRQKLLSHL